MITSKGWVEPVGDELVFNQEPSQYYKFNNIINSSSDSLFAVSQALGAGHSSDQIERLRTKRLDWLESISEDPVVKQLNRGLSIPFIIPRMELRSSDIGDLLEDVVHPAIENRFLDASYDQVHFKASMQGDLQLRESIDEADNQIFSSLRNGKNILGVYCPTALAGYSLDSLGSAISRLRTAFGTSSLHVDSGTVICLSGIIEVSAVLLAHPRILMDSEKYSPVLVCDGNRHANPNVVLCYKSYGPHLEFWGMSRWLVPGVGQVSEQFAQGITIYTAV